MVSATDGSPTNTGWNRRSSAGSFSTCLRYSFTVVAPMACSSPRARAGFSMLPASIAPSAAPAPTMVCISSMKRTICPSEATTSFSTALSRSSNSPRYFAPATIEARSRPSSRFPLSPSGTSPSTIRRASPSTMAVLPTPGSPTSTGLFLVRRERILDDAADLVVPPDHRVELPLAGELGEVLRVLLEGAVLALRLRGGDAGAAADVLQRAADPVGRRPGGPQRLARGPFLLRGGEEEVLARDVLVLELLRLVLRAVDELREAVREVRLGAGDAGDRSAARPRCARRRGRGRRRSCRGRASRSPRPGRGARARGAPPRPPGGRGGAPPPARRRAPPGPSR